MEQSQLIPFVRTNLHILFVGLNPAVGSSRNKHYFSVNQAFWNQLYGAGLITSRVDKSNADALIFGDNTRNYDAWKYGITDLIPAIAKSDSGKVVATQENCKALANLIREHTPKTVVLLHSKVCKHFLKFLGHPVSASNSGSLGKLIPNCPTQFFDIAFPHGNSVTSESKVQNYKRVKEYLEASM